MNDLTSEVYRNAPTLVNKEMVLVFRDQKFVGHTNEYVWCIIPGPDIELSSEDAERFSIYAAKVRRETDFDALPTRWPPQLED